MVLIVPVLNSGALRLRWISAVALAGVLAWPDSSQAVLFADYGDAAHNTSAPTGLWEDSGWQYLGYYGGFLGTAISANHFITAAHIGVQGSTFSSDSVFSGGPTINYTVDQTVNGGIGYWDIPGSDLRVYQITGTFSQWAELYTGTATGSEVVMTGRGGVRGDAVFVNSTLKGYKHTGGDGVARWGTNTINGLSGSGAGTVLVASFDNSPGTTEEAGMSAGDSGGGLFALEGGVWKLAGVNYGVDGLFDTNDTENDGSEFMASLFDRGGLYEGMDSSGWTLVSDSSKDKPSNLYFSSIAANADAIKAITALPVPEPGGAVLVAIGGLAWGLRRRRGSCQERLS